MHVTAIIAAGGSGRRLGAAVPKQLLDVGGRLDPRAQRRRVRSHPGVTEVIVALPAALAAAPPAWLAARRRRVRLVAGGDAAAGFGGERVRLRRRADATSCSFTMPRGRS